MKIWIVLYIVGKLIAAWGPNPAFDSTQACIDAASYNNRTLVRGTDVKISCVIAVEAPQLGSSIDNLK
jgi:hypothetical protein